MRPTRAQAVPSQVAAFPIDFVQSSKEDPTRTWQVPGWRLASQKVKDLIRKMGLAVLSKLGHGQQNCIEVWGSRLGLVMSPN